MKYVAVNIITTNISKITESNAITKYVHIFNVIVIQNKPDTNCKECSVGTRLL